MNGLNATELYTQKWLKLYGRYIIMQKKPKKLSVPFDLVIPLLAMYSKGTDSELAKNLGTNIFLKVYLS